MIDEKAFDIANNEAAKYGWALSYTDLRRKWLKAYIEATKIPMQPPSEAKMERMVEVMARALFEEYYPHGSGSSTSYDVAEDAHKRNLRRNAKASLTALLREFPQMGRGI